MHIKHLICYTKLTESLGNNVDPEQYLEAAFIIISQGKELTNCFNMKIIYFCTFVLAYQFLLQLS